MRYFFYLIFLLKFSRVQRASEGKVEGYTGRRFDCREAPRGDRLSGRGSINHTVSSRALSREGEDYYGIRAIR